MDKTLSRETITGGDLVKPPTGFQNRCRGYKKTHPINQMGYTLRRLFSKLDLTYLPYLMLRQAQHDIGMELAPFPDYTSGEVVKASSGHYPLPFLISICLKNWCKVMATSFKVPNIFLALLIFMPEIEIKRHT